jgi:hypothetical protein
MLQAFEYKPRFIYKDTRPEGSPEYIPLELHAWWAKRPGLAPADLSWTPNNSRSSQSGRDTPLGSISKIILAASNAIGEEALENSVVSFRAKCIAPEAVAFAGSSDCGNHVSPRTYEKGLVDTCPASSIARRSCNRVGLSGASPVPISSFEGRIFL